MKPLTKTTVNRGGGIAARFAKLSPPPEKLDSEAKKLWNKVNKEIAAKPFPKVANPELAKPVANEPVANVANQSRYAKWREANPELYKQRQAAYMRKRRAADKLRKEQDNAS